MTRIPLRLEYIDSLTGLTPVGPTMHPFGDLVDHKQRSRAVRQVGAGLGQSHAESSRDRACQWVWPISSEVSD